MYSFLKIVSEPKGGKNPAYVIRPEFLVNSKYSSDLMIRGKDFYAVWDEETKLWSCDENTVISNVDKEIQKVCDGDPDKIYIPKFMMFASSGSIDNWHKYVQKQLRDNYHQLDIKVIFSNMETTKKDYATKKLPYPLEQGKMDAYNEIMDTLYNPEERDKLEWAIGSIIAGDSKKIQKFIVLYGAPGSGKGTFLEIVQKLFEGYWATFDAKALGSANNSFALETLKSNPLVAIQTDGDLSRIEDNTKLNSIVSHEEITVNEKHKSIYSMKFNSFLFLGTNKPVKITDDKSGLLRRLIDVYPSGRKIPADKYRELTKRVNFELGAIAYHCLQKYNDMGIDYYNTYVPLNMIAETNDFYDFMEYYYDEFCEKDYVTLKDVWALYKTYTDMANIRYPMAMRSLRIELKGYFNEEYEDYRDDTGKHLRNVYKDFKKERFHKVIIDTNKRNDTWLKFTTHKSVFDIYASDYPAQLATEDGKPRQKWADVQTTLKDIDTSKLHYVKVPMNHIVIDFDIKDENGEKSLEKNMEAASKFPPTYAELSKSEAGVHLHYIYDGDVNKLSRVYDDNIEIKVFAGKSSLRRKLTKCTELLISTINSGLPLKEEKEMVDFTAIKNEKSLRTLIKKNLNKEIHANTKPSIDFIYKILEDAYKSGMVYDVSDMRQAVLYFASSSSNNAEYCMGLVTKMHFTSDTEPEFKSNKQDDRIVFYDVEVFPNLFLVNWKFDGAKEVNRMINPTAEDIAGLTCYKLVGFNNRRYDNHMLYARMMGYDNEGLYKLSQRLVKEDKGVANSAMFMNAYNMSYADIYDFMSTKQSLKKWEIELGIHHQELGLPWDEPVPEDKWEEVAEYCDNDVIATEALFHSKQCQADFVAREIIASISGLSVNHSTNSHSARIIFGDNRHPQDAFVYTDLSEMFPGYEFKLVDTEVEVGGKKTKKKLKKSIYKGVEVGEGGYVYGMPGMYDNVWTFDVASMHPHSAIELNLFGDQYTKTFKELVDVRIAIKNGDYDKASKMFDGKLKPYLNDKSQAKMLSNALKIVINSVYGLTSASFDNPFRDPRNVDNIVAKRGALFMVDLKCALEERGIQVIHIKTDSIKVSNPSEEIQKFIYNFGKKYGYTFEVENIFERFCLVNDAVYIAKYATPKIEDGKEIWWSATGAQFAQPYVYKTLFSKEKIEFEDMCETKSVKTAIYLDMNEGKDDHDYKFVGRVGLFCPMKPGAGGGELVAERNKVVGGQEVKKMDSVTGAKGYRWLEAETVKDNKLEDQIDKTYYTKFVDEAVETLSKYGDVEAFIA